MTPAVKICGITRAADALHAEALGAAAVGFIFYPKSPRYLEPDSARDISDLLGPFVARVGVFVNETAGHISETARSARLTAVQYHGDTDPRTIADATGLRVIMAFRIGPGFDPASIRETGADACLLDACVPGQYGGTGETCDWDTARACTPFGRVILAGGLHSGNVTEAVRRVRPWGVDVSSGVESAPGVKDHNKMRAFFRALDDTGTSESCT